MRGNLFLHGLIVIALCFATIASGPSIVDGHIRALPTLFLVLYLLACVYFSHLLLEWFLRIAKKIFTRIAKEKQVTRS